MKATGFISGIKIVDGKLPLDDNAIVHGNLDLRGTAIRRLPRGLTVWGFLDVGQSEIEALPNQLVVHGDVFLDGTRLKGVPRSAKVMGVVRGTRQHGGERLPNHLRPAPAYTHKVPG